MDRRVRVMLCEGRDDLAALRALVRAEVGPEFQEGRGREPMELRFESPRLVLRILQTMGKSELARRALNLQTAGERPDLIGVCFDPDRDTVGREFAFFVQSFDREARNHASALTSIGAGAYTFRQNNRDVSVLPAPWRLPDAARFDALPDDEQNLERVFIAGILETQSPHRAWAEDAVARLHAAAGDHGWKRAFRIWNAALFPDSESFVDRLLQAPRNPSDLP